MQIHASIPDSPDMINELRQCATLLSEKLENDQYGDAAVLIKSLTEHRDQHIFQSIGKLTRGLHDSIVNFNIGSETPVVPNKDDHFTDASNRLNYVIEITQNAANKTMDMVEESAPISSHLASEAVDLKKEWLSLKDKGMNTAEFSHFSQSMDSFFEKMDSGTSNLNENLQNIILEQGFQDLTGQVLKRVIELVTEVEEELVSLVRIAGQVEEIVGIKTVPENPQTTESKQGDVKAPDIAGEGPQINAAARNDVVNGQDDVDDLLSSLGF